jgi:hypothetical protein
MKGRPTKEGLEQEIEALTEELKERKAALPVHSVRPAQFEAIEELEELIESKRKELKNLGV